MKPFKMFFALAIGIIIFSFLAKVVFMAFIAAVIMSIVYATYRRIKDFITYDQYGEYYMKGYDNSNRRSEWNNSRVEPLFQESNSRGFQQHYKTQHFVKIT